MSSNKWIIFAFVIFTIFAATACESTSALNNPSNGNINFGSAVGPTPSPAPDPSAPPRTFDTQVLLFNGTGISTSDWQSVEQILIGNGYSYKLVDSPGLDAMSPVEIASFGTMIFPGGYSSTITSGLKGQTRINIRNAVLNNGVGYVGFCAGAGTAVSPSPAVGQAPSFGFSLLNGPILDEYLPNGQEPTAAMVTVSFADGATRDLIWVGGPITPNWAGGVVGRYKTGDPAFSQAFAGRGLVEISGPHPEAPSGWPAGYGLTDSDGVDHDIAIKMINAAIHGQPLPTF